VNLEWCYGEGGVNLVFNGPSTSRRRRNKGANSEADKEVKAGGRGAVRVAKGTSFKVAPKKLQPHESYSLKSRTYNLILEFSLVNNDFMS
jgi:hypothetical protein